MCKSAEVDALWAALIASGVIPVCAGCNTPVQRQDYCWGCGTFICKPCDQHIEEAE